MLNSIVSPEAAAAMVSRSEPAPESCVCANDDYGALSRGKSTDEGEKKENEKPSGEGFHNAYSIDRTRSRQAELLTF